MQSLTVYRNILKDPVVQAYMEHLTVLADPPGKTHPAATYGRVYNLLAQTSNPMRTVDAWQNHILDLMLDDINPFTRAAFSTAKPGYEALLDGVKRDLNILRLAFENGAVVIREATMNMLPNHPPLPANLESLPLWAAPAPGNEKQLPFTARRLELKQKLAATVKWAGLAGALAEYHASFGFGVYGRFIAYKWLKGTLQGIEHPDPVKLSDLVGYEDVRKEVIRNTLQFLHGYPANNILLYGDRGTGKSSTVKALLNEYWPKGLRLVEVPKHALSEFQSIMTCLRDLKHRYIIFIDDLSFEEHETQYKDFKALLEGGIELRPENVLVYATSNRRHIVKETLSDRAKSAGEEVRTMDSLQEKLSLADRFGITIIFPTPDQELFIKIVAGLAKKRHLPVSPGELRKRALLWSNWHNGRSPRAARQFIDQLEGELAMKISNL